MKIWILDRDVNNYASLKFVSGFDLDLVLSFRGEAKKDNWTSPKFVRINNLPFGNTTGLLSYTPFFDDEAVKELDCFLEGNAELLPLNCPEGNFYVVNVTKVLDCLNLERSEYKSFSDGRIMRMIKYVFYEGIVRDIDVFKVKGLEGRDVFVSDKFKNKVEESQLTGFKFTLVWDSELVEIAPVISESIPSIEKRDLQQEKDMPKSRAFEYVEKLLEKEEKELKKDIIKTEHIFSIKSKKEGKEIAKQLNDIVDNILNTGACPRKYNGNYETAKALGILYGYAISLEYGWKFEKLGSFKGNTKLSVVSPKEGYSIQLTDYIYKILSKKNIGPDGNNDNTVLLLFNMIANLNEEKSECKYSPLS